jgi:hypothetical protein
MIGWKKRGAALVAVGVSLLAVSSQVSSAALAKLAGGSGYSGALSSNRNIRNQQLACDPATPSASPAASAPASSGAPVSGSTSVTYDPEVVTLSGLQFGPGYVGSGFVELAGESPTGASKFLEPISQFLALKAEGAEPGVETGYVQVGYRLNINTDAPVNPGEIPPPSGFTLVDSNGVKGVDTHALMFTYLDVPDTTVAKYQIYADTGKRPSGNTTDSLTGIGPDGKSFTLGPDQLSSATVSGSLVTATVPLPPAAWMGLATLASLGVWGLMRKKAFV